MTIQLITDSTAYIPCHLIKKYNIQVVSLSVQLNGLTKEETTVEHGAFYQELSQSKEWATSSQPTLETFLTLFQKAIDKRKEIFGVFLSSAMSGTYQTARMAKQMILEKEPSAKIHLIDSQTNCMQMGFAVLEAAKLIEEGLDTKEVIQQVQNFVNRSRFLFAPLSLQYLRKGGRIGGAAAFIGSVLRIVPILTVENGRTSVFNKVRTQKKAQSTMVQAVLEDFQQYGEGDLVVHHINDETAGHALASKLSEPFNREIPVLPIGPVIGLHVGPGTVGIAYYTAKNRISNEPAADKNQPHLKEGSYENY
ncbi:DegV family protein [Tindallia californiensis]|uniref:EDD domain protein, DegV family n=1 Tax=Tindallia californiensis TaxID=159292 RepID=A0A1H3LMI1_9FIRM|nr:DegV family protein [Tindallia californiensis]SDY65164.1 EDD domain protein, DegV family [Tindallia californiensis]